MKFLLVTALLASAFVAPAQAADLLVEDKINAPYAPKWSPAPKPRPEIDCYLSAAFGLIKVPCSEGFEYEEPGGDNPTTEVGEEPRCETSSKVPHGTKGKKGKKGGKKGHDGKKGGKRGKQRNR